MPDNSDDQYRVGYRKPPLHTRFQKGRSGNPSGKPKGIRNLPTLIQKSLGARTEIEINGRPKRVSMLEAAVWKLVGKAASGDPKILQMLIAECQRFDPRGEKAPEMYAQTEAEAEEELTRLISRVLDETSPNGDAAVDGSENAEDVRAVPPVADQS